jgi:hypothetical protein
MPTTSETDSSSGTTRECKHPDCSTLGHVWEFHHGKFCSTECETRQDAREAVLAGLQHDHTVCYTCVRTQKQLIEPKPDFEFTERGHGWTFDENGEPTLQYYGQEVTREAAVGRQYLEPPADKGEKQRRTDGDELAKEVVTGTICEDCGQTDHRIHDPLLADRAAIGRLVARIKALDEVAVDPHQLHREYAAHADLELAVGRALQ